MIIEEGFGVVGLSFSVVMATFFESDYAGLYEQLAICPAILFNLALGIRSLKATACKPVCGRPSFLEFANPLLTK